MAELKEITKKLQEIHEKIKAEIPWEPIGHTPMPEIPDLRNWDMKLLKTYKPFYAPFCDLCCFCTYGKCDLTEDRRGGCGIDIGTQQARWILLSCLMGCSAHASHAGHILDVLIEKHGPDKKINLGTSVDVEAPNMFTKRLPIFLIPLIWARREVVSIMNQSPCMLACSTMWEWK
jgi:acetyl-CoA decarbonylase/synthase complex subunit alpha